MSDNRWQRIEEIFHRALEFPPEARSAFLNDACATDQSLRQDVESLLAHESENGSTFVGPAGASAPQTIAHYRITGKLGEGGMGAVYRATDLKLGRDVAIKVLPAAFAGDADRMARFQREARVLASLNHPNIAAIYGVENRALIMELVEGKDLRGPLPIATALHYAAQIAGALQFAHEKGIVHRDLKPANIRITPEGVVKVLDFGLAKATLAGPDSEDSPTITLRATQPGVIMGTAAYMSPEQAQGAAVDTRSDIFAFGAVLYEMLTGRKAFHGSTALSVLAAVLKDEPERLGSVVGGIPAELERIVARCLRKNPARRFQNAADLKIALEELLEEGDTAPAAPGVAVRSNWRWLFGALFLTALVAAAIFNWRLMQSPQASPLLVLKRVTADTGLATDPALSPDATLVAYASDRSGEGNLDIWVQPVSGGTAVRLTNHETDDHQPAFSPDGARIAFRSERDGGGIYIMPALGGEPTLVVRNGIRPQFSPDGKKILYGVNRTIGQLYVVPASGGTPTRLQPQLFGATDGVWAPDGKHILFLGLSAPIGVGRGEWWIATLDGTPTVAITARDVIDRYGLLPPPGEHDIAPSLWLEREDQVVFSARLGDTTDLWTLQVSPATGKVTGRPRRLTVGTGLHRYPSFAARRSTPKGRSLGVIALANLNDNIDVWSLPLDADHGAVRGEMTRLTHDASPDTNVSASRQGERAVFVSTRSGSQHVWMKDLRSGAETQLTAGDAARSFPVISIDGNRVAYATREGEKWSIDAVSLDTKGRTGAEQRLCVGCGVPTSWSLDTKRLLYVVFPQAHIGLLDFAAGFGGDVVSHPKNSLWQGEFSPDDRWVAFMAGAGSTGLIYLVPADALRHSPSPGTWIAISDGETWDDKPRWSPDGNLLYFISERDGFRCLWAQRLDVTTKRSSGAPFAVQHFHSSRLSLTNVEYSAFEISITRSRVLFSAGEVTGNIWAAEILEPN